MSVGHGHRHHGREARRKGTQRVALVGALVNLVLAIVKISIGWIARSQSLIADGLHSLSDLASDLLVWWAGHHANQAPDEEHPYGHGRFETAATLALGALLAVVAGGIMFDSVQRLFEPDRLWQPNAFALYAALFSIIANEGLYWYTLAASKQLNSDLLRANAWHHRSDAISSVVVLAGVGGTQLGFPWVDAVAAIIVGVMIAKVGWDLGWGAMQELVDASLDEETVAEIKGQIESIHGVRSMHMLRTRRQGHEALADVHVEVHPWVSVSEGHMISLAVESRIKQAVDDLNDVTVHIDPEDDERDAPCHDLPLRDEVLRELRAAWADTDCVESADRIVLHYLSGRIHVQLFLPWEFFPGTDQVEGMTRGLRERLDPMPHYGKLEVYFGSHRDGAKP